MKNKHIAIIGGGLSGILAAYKLSRLGNKVTIFEKNEFLGGELASISLDYSWPIEYFYHHIFLGNHRILALFRDLGIEKSIRWYPSSVSVLKDGQTFPFSSPVDLIKLPGLPLFTKIRMGMSSQIIPHISYRKFANVTAKEMITRWMGAEAWTKFWEPMFRLKFADYAEEISGVWFWGRLKDRVSSRNGGELLGYPDGGFQVLLDKLTDKLSAQNVKIVLDHPVTQVQRKENHFMIGNEVFDSLICATPLPVATEILPISDKEKAELKQIKHLAAVTVLLETKDKITDCYWTNILDENLGFNVMVEQTNLIDPEHYPHHLIYLGRYQKNTDPMYKKTDDDIADSFITSLESIYPNLRDNIVKYHVFRDKYAQPIITKSYKKPSYTYSIPELYILSSAHIYPYDRGLDRVFEEVNKIVTLI